MTNAVMQKYLDRLAVKHPVIYTLHWLALQPTNSLSPSDRGNIFYFLGIAAFMSHDYQSAAFFFDTAASEDFKVRNAKRDNLPAHLFMCLDHLKPNQIAQVIVEGLVKKLTLLIDSYNTRQGASLLSVPELREHFLRPQMRQRKKQRRTLITTFISFLAEWDYRLQTIEISTGGTKEPFFTHLFRGCLLFESLLKSSNVPPPKHKRTTLSIYLNDPNFKARLGIGSCHRLR